MRIKVFSAVVLCLIFQGAFADDEIRLNGTYGKKAILLIKGELLMLTEGETVKGVKLIKVYPDKVNVIYRKKPLTLTFEQTLSGESLGFANKTPIDESKTHILYAKVIEQSDSSAVFELEYFYDGQRGRYVTLTAKTLLKDKLTEFWSHSYTKLKSGRHRVKITVNMNAKAPQQYYSDAVQFEMLWASETGSGLLDSKSIAFFKHWKKL